MSSSQTPVNIARLLTTFNIKTRALPDDLKCAQCKSVLKDACQVPCGCQFCRTCIDGLMARGSQFCPGGSQECNRTPLSTVVPDYMADKSILMLMTKCTQTGCSHECPLADMEDHLQMCSRKSVDCPFRELGCPHGGLAAEEVICHLPRESRSHSEILIEMVAKINKNMKMLKRKLVIKDQQERRLKNEIKSIKREREVLSNRVRRLAENLERESVERRQTEEHNSTRIKEQLDSMKSLVESIQKTIGLGQLDDWLIEEDLSKMRIDWYVNKTSDKFRGVGRPYTYDLAIYNYPIESELCIFLRIWSYPSNSVLDWPFRGAVTITVAHRDNAKKCMRQTQKCLIERPSDNQFRCSEPIKFPHDALRGAGLDLERGVRVSCLVVLISAQ